MLSSIVWILASAQQSHPIRTLVFGALLVLPNIVLSNLSLISPHRHNVGPGLRIALKNKSSNIKILNTFYHET